MMSRPARHPTTIALPACPECGRPLMSEPFPGGGIYCRPCLGIVLEGELYRDFDRYLAARAAPTEPTP